MKIDDAVETAALFFNDLIGTLIPGIVLGVGLLVMHVGLTDALKDTLDNLNGFLVFIVLALFFATGHAVLALHALLVNPLLQKMGLLEKVPSDNQKQKQSYRLFHEMMVERIRKALPNRTNDSNEIDWSYHDLRSVALSLSNEGSSLGRRFMFISLLCNGVATALLALLVDFFICTLIAPNSLVLYDVAWPASLQGLLLILLAIMLFKRGGEFYIRAMSTPFAVALAELINDRHINATE